MSDQRKAANEPHAARTLDDFIGQDRIREHLRVAITAAKQRGEALEHVLLVGPEGTGKGTLGAIIAHELGVAMRQANGTSMGSPQGVAAMLSNMQAREVLFLGDVDRVPPVFEALLVSAMRDYELDIVIGKGPRARSVKVPLQRFTVVGSTTREGLVSASMRKEFGIVLRLHFDGPESLDGLDGLIITMAKSLGVAIEPKAAHADATVTETAISVRRLETTPIRGDGSYCSPC